MIIGGKVEDLGYGGNIGWPEARVTSKVFNTGAQGAVAFAEIPNSLALIAWIFKDEVAAIDRQIDQDADDKAALSHASLKPHEALRKTLQKPDPAFGGNDATAGMPPVDRAADCKFAGNSDPLRGIIASNSDPF